MTGIGEKQGGKIYSFDTCAGYKDVVVRLLRQSYCSMCSTDNAGTSWSLDEENHLIANVQSNKSWNDIAVYHRRTVCAVQSRLKHIAFKMVQNGASVDYVASQLCQTTSQINQAIDWSMKQKEADKDRKKEAESETAKRLQLIEQRLATIESALLKIMTKM